MHLDEWKRHRPHAYNVARFMHHWYELYARDWGWDTQESTRVDFDDLPPANQMAMLETAQNLIENWDRLKPREVMGLEFEKREDD